MTTTVRLCFLAAILSAGAAPTSRAADDAAAIEFFESKVRPILAERCYRCHSVEAGKAKGQLQLDTRGGVLKGGETGPALVPGKPDQSLLIKAVRYIDDKLQMPPKEPLSKEQVAILEQWVRIGAPDPRAAPRTVATTRLRDHWALKPVHAIDPPAVRDASWPAGPIDRFILARLESKLLAPAPPAGTRELFRRVTFDLTGLPPSPEEVDAFLADDSPTAYEKAVDRLLASPRYGERWGRHWLDVVRFGESHGYEQNHLRDRAWPYRDYVIRAFNDDKPYTRFVAEQLAADAIAPDDPLAQPATGFLVAGVHDTVANNAEAGKRQQRADDLDDIVSTVGATFLGLTVGCAKCHDHKFDPIPQADYYALCAVLAGVRHEERALPEVFSRDPKGSASTRPAVSPRRNVDEFPPVAARFVRFTVLATRDGTEPCIDELEVYAGDDKTNLALATAGAKATASSVLPGNALHQISHLNDGRYGNDRSWISNQRGGGWAQIELAAERPVSRVVWSRDRAEPPRFADRVPSQYRIEVSLDGEKWKTVSSHEGRAAAEKKAAYIGAFGAPDPIYLLKRGDVMQRGEIVAPSGLTQIPGLPADLALDLGAPEPARRAALARWICDPRNPLTARVIVNRVWQHHFGRGLVPTPSDLGANGEPPSHPELLDWLAADFVRGGWTLKRLHRQIVLSQTYRQAGRPDDARLAAGMSADGGNQLLWRMPLRRLEAEAVRDSILAVSGKLDLSPAAVRGPGFKLFNYRVVNIALYEPRLDQGPDTWRRAVFQQTARNIHDDLMAAFDEPENAQRSPRREVTTNPIQALTLMHSPFVVRQSELFAQRVSSETADVPAQVNRAFQLALGRAPSNDERVTAIELTRRHGLPALCRGLFNTNEFLTY